MTPRRFLVFLALFCALTPLTFAADFDTYDDCNWLVTYRGRTYDLAPLTRESLARPVDGDIRSILERVPESESLLSQVEKRSADAKAHTIIASAAVSGLLVTRLLRSNEKNRERHDTYDILTAVTGLFFLKGAYESWRATRDAKETLLKAVRVFNENSPNKIEPVPQSGP